MMKHKWSNPFEAAKAASEINRHKNVEERERIPSTCSMDYLTPQNQPTYLNMEEKHNQLQIDSMFNKTKSKLNYKTTIQEEEDNKQERYSAEYKELELLHNGRFYKTYKCLNKIDRNEYVIKHDNDKITDQETEILIREALILSSLQRNGTVCKHIIIYFDMFRQLNYCYVVLECCKSNMLSLRK
eukprot:142317_1